MNRCGDLGASMVLTKRPVSGYRRLNENNLASATERRYGFDVNGLFVRAASTWHWQQLAMVQVLK